MQDVVEGSQGHILADNSYVGWVAAHSNHRQNVEMCEQPAGGGGGKFYNYLTDRSDVNDHCDIIMIIMIIMIITWVWEPPHWTASAAELRGSGFWASWYTPGSGPSFPCRSEIVHCIHRIHCIHRTSHYAYVDSSRQRTCNYNANWCGVSKPDAISCDGSDVETWAFFLIILFLEV